MRCLLSIICKQLWRLISDYNILHKNIQLYMQLQTNYFLKLTQQNCLKPKQCFPTNKQKEMQCCAVLLSLNFDLLTKCQPHTKNRTSVADCEQLYILLVLNSSKILSKCKVQQLQTIHQQSYLYFLCYPAQKNWQIVMKYITCRQS